MSPQVIVWKIRSNFIQLILVDSVTCKQSSHSNMWHFKTGHPQDIIFCFALLCSVAGKKPHAIFVNQSQVKQKPNVTCSHVCYAWHRFFNLPRNVTQGRVRLR